MFNVPWADYADDLVDGIIATLQYTVLGFVGAFILGLALALIRLSRFKVLRGLAAAYTELFKNIPLLAVIFLIYFGLATVDITLDVLAAGTLSLVAFYGAYLSEIFRSAISSVPTGQTEVSLALGFGRVSTLFSVILPQALRTALPGTNTMLVDLLKSTSLLITISAAELMTQAQLIASETFRALEVYLVIAVLYFAMCYPLSQFLLWLERRLAAGKPLGPGRRKRLQHAAALLESYSPAQKVNA